MATQDHGFERSSHVGSNDAELRLVGGAHPIAGVRQRLQPQVDNNFTLVFAFTKILDQLGDFAEWIGAVNYDMPIASLSTKFMGNGNHVGIEINGADVLDIGGMMVQLLGRVAMAW